MLDKDTTHAFLLFLAVSFCVLFIPFKKLLDADKFLEMEDFQKDQDFFRMSFCSEMRET